MSSFCLRMTPSQPAIAPDIREDQRHYKSHNRPTRQNDGLRARRRGNDPPQLSKAQNSLYMAIPSPVLKFPASSWHPIVLAALLDPDPLRQATNKREPHVQYGCPKQYLVDFVMLELDPTSSISGTLGQNETVRVVLVFKFIEYPGMMSNTAPQAPGDFPHGADGTDSSSFTGGDLGRSRGKVHEVCPGWCNIC